MFLDCPPPVRKQAAEDPTQYTVPRIATRVTTRRGLASVIWRTSSLFYKQQGVLTLDTRPLGHHDNHHTHNTQTRVHLSCLARTQSHTLHMCMTHLTRVEAADDLQPSSRSAALPDRGPCPRGRRAAGRSLKNIQGGWRWPSSGGEAEAAMQVFHDSPHLEVDERLHALLVVDKRASWHTIMAYDSIDEVCRLGEDARSELERWHRSES